MYLSSHAAEYSLILRRMLDYVNQEYRLKYKYYTVVNLSYG